MNEPELKRKLLKLMQEGEKLRARLESILEADSPPHGDLSSGRVSKSEDSTEGHTQRTDGANLNPSKVR